jgi:hypothetical protein
MSRLQLLEEAYAKVHEYTTTQPWRPGLVDLWVYNILINFHESDYDNGTNIPDFIWTATPDEVMQHIIDSSRIFDLEYGWDQLDEDIRDYLKDNKFISDPMDIEDETEEEGE